MAFLHVGLNITTQTQSKQQLKSQSTWLVYTKYFYPWYKDCSPINILWTPKFLLGGSFYLLFLV